MQPQQPSALVLDTPGTTLLPGEKKFRWSKEANFASQWISDGNLTYKEICEKLSISPVRLAKWRKHSEFKARVEDLRDQYRDYIYHKGIARLEKRVETYLDDWDNLEAIRKGRANQATENSLPIPTEVTIEGETIHLNETPGTPTQEGSVILGSGQFNPAGGVETGFIGKDYKGKDADVPVYFFDKALWDARLRLREQISRELGQWQDKSTIKTDQPAGNTVQITNVTITAAISEHLAATRRAARSGVVVDVSPVQGQLVEGHPPPGCSSTTGTTPPETGTA